MEYDLNLNNPMKQNQKMKKSETPSETQKKTPRDTPRENPRESPREMQQEKYSFEATYNRKRPNEDDKSSTNPTKKKRVINKIAAPVRSECSHPSVDPATCLCIVCGESSFIQNIDAFDYRDKPTEKKVELFAPGEMALFSPEIIKKANEISNRMVIGSNRKTRRLFRKFFCLYNAHLELGLVVEARFLAKNCDMQPNQISAALTSFCYAKSGYEPRPPDRYELPIEEHASIKIMKQQAARLQLTDDSIKIIETILLSALKSKNKEIILARDMGTIAAASIYVFCKLYSHEIPQQKFKDNGMIFSASTISQAKTEILNGYNSYMGE